MEHCEVSLSKCVGPSKRAEQTLLAVGALIDSRGLLETKGCPTPVSPRHQGEKKERLYTGEFRARGV